MGFPPPGRAWGCVIVEADRLAHGYGFACLGRFGSAEVVSMAVARPERTLTEFRLGAGHDPLLPLRFEKS
jgi:hypothetical protein